MKISWIQHQFPLWYQRQWTRYRYWNRFFPILFFGQGFCFCFDRFDFSVVSSFCCKVIRFLDCVKVKRVNKWSKVAEKRVNSSQAGSLGRIQTCSSGIAFGIYARASYIQHSVWHISWTGRTLCWNWTEVSVVHQMDRFDLEPNKSLLTCVPNWQANFVIIDRTRTIAVW